MSVILRTEKLCKSFSNGGLQQHIIKNLDLEIKENDFTIIMGASGSGKSTLLYALSGMDAPTLGSVYFGGNDISKYSNDQLAVFRRENCGFVFQSIYLLENQTVLDNVLTGALIVQKNSPKLVQKAKDLLIRVGIKEEMWNKYPNQLSGGEAQRVGIVRAIINEPKILFADEPTAELDTKTGLQVVKIFKDLVKEEGNTIVMTTHDAGFMEIGDMVYELSDGQVLKTYIDGKEVR